MTRVLALLVSAALPALAPAGLVLPALARPAQSGSAQPGPAQSSLAQSSPAQPGPVRPRPAPGDGTDLWAAVGRLDLGYGAFCTATLVSPSHILTAAHCLTDAATGEPIPTEQMIFRAGWQDGLPATLRFVRRAAVHPDHDAAAAPGRGRVAGDLALLELTRPVPAAEIAPLAVASDLPDAARVGVVSFVQGTAEAAPLRQLCEVLERRDGVAVLGCDIDSGASGAPAFRLDGGVPQLAAVISAKAEAEGRPVALSRELGAELGRLEGLLAAATEVR